MKEHINIEEIENGDIRIRGQLMLHDCSKDLDENEIMGVAIEDIKKGQIGKIKI